MDFDYFQLYFFDNALPSTSAPTNVNDPPQYLPPPPAATIPWVYQQERAGYLDSQVTPSVEAECAPKRRRGRPRKYDTPQPAQRRRKIGRPRKYDKLQPYSMPQRRPSPVSQRPDFASDSLAGGLEHDFTPHVVEAVAGEDVNQKILLLPQQSQRRVCILSAYGMVMNASVCQPGISGVSQAYKGQFHIVSLAVIYGDDGYGPTLRLGACLLGRDGTVVSGEVDGPLIAAGPVTIVLGSFSPTPRNGSLVEISVSDPIWVNNDDLSSGGNPSIHEAQNIGVSFTSLLNQDPAPDATISGGIGKGRCIPHL